MGARRREGTRSTADATYSARTFYQRAGGIDHAEPILYWTESLAPLAEFPAQNKADLIAFAVIAFLCTDQ